MYDKFNIKLQTHDAFFGFSIVISLTQTHCGSEIKTGFILHYLRFTIQSYNLLVINPG